MQSFIASLSYYKSDVFVIHIHLRVREDRKFSYKKQKIFSKCSIKVEIISVAKEIIMMSMVKLYIMLRIICFLDLLYQ